MTSPADEPFERLRRAARGEPVALLHSGGAGPAWLFERPVDVLELPATAAGSERAFDDLDAFLARHAARHCVGFFGYDLRDAVEALPRRIADDLAQPAMHVAAFARRTAWDRAPPPSAGDAPPARDVRAHTSRAGYEAAVARVVEHICAGDVFQANLSQPFSGRYDGDPRALFQRLCAVSPAPFAAYVETATGLSVLSSSPEEFLRVDGRTARTRPIKGTRPRGADPVLDRALLDELLGSEKDRAELAMIVDLMRNDLGKVAEVGSVQVGPFPEHASFAQVHHLFATVTATLRAGVTPGALLRATFPAGSITGAPKLRSMEILEDLEVARRGVYTGAVGWFGPGPRLHLSVAIRTMVVDRGRVRLNAGGGVTADSVPALEYDEMLHKASGLLRALGADTEVIA